MSFNICVGNVIDAFLADYDVLVHGCNCFHLMGAGIAKALSSKWPKILHVDKLTSYGDKNKLGTWSYVEVLPGKIIVNAYTQFQIGHEALDVNAFTKCFLGILHYFGQDLGANICFPAVGMGLAGGKPKELIPILDNISVHTINKFDMYVLTTKIQQEYLQWKK